MPPRAVPATILLVEDEANIRTLAADALRDLGCIVIEAATGSEALQRLRNGGGSSAKVDMLITDVGLPGGLNGRQLADAARELLPDVPVLLITGYAGTALGKDRDLAPGMQLLGKPFALATLADRVRGALTTGVLQRL
jgi:CheY-like chemotaxis protein